MSTSHAQVAEKFVAGQSAKGSRLISAAGLSGVAAVSYATVVATIRDDRLQITPTNYSASTLRHKQLILSAWGRKRVAAGYPYDSGVFHTVDIVLGATHRNVGYWVDAATKALGTVLNRRCKPITRAFSFLRFHTDTRSAADIFWLLPTAPSGYEPTGDVVSRLKAYTTLCAAVPSPEWTDAGLTPLTPDDYLRIIAVVELERV